MRFVVAFLLMIACNAYAQDFNLFEKKTFITSKGDTLPYRILYPENYDRSKNIRWFCFFTEVVKKAATTRSNLHMA